MPLDLATRLAFIPASLALNLTPGADLLFCLTQSRRFDGWMRRITATIFGALAVKLAKTAT